MNPIIDYLFYASYSLAALFVFYVIIFSLLNVIRKNYLEHHWLVRPAFLVLVVLFLIADWWVNMVISFVFLDAPKRIGELVTDRLKRYKKRYNLPYVQDKTNWLESFRYVFAVRLCRLLNKYDADHC